MRRKLGVLAAVVSILVVLVEGYLAYRNGMLAPSQAAVTYPGQHRLPFVCHGGMWSDVFIMTPLIGLIVGTCCGTWTFARVACMFVFGMLLSGGMHALYANAPFPDSLAWQGTGITPAGYVHLAYMGCAFGVLGLFYLCTPNPPPWLVVLCGLLLCGHCVIATHIPLGIINACHPIPWCPNLINSPTFPTVLGGWTIIIALTIRIRRRSSRPRSIVEK